MEKVVTPYNNIPFLPLENQDQDSRHGAQFFRNVKQLQVGFGSKVFRVDRDGMWAGAEDMASAPWSVDWDGNMVANSITLTGYIPTGGALTDIGAGNITGTYIASGAITTAKIAANAITANEISAGAVTASKISVSSLSAINANLGTITAGSISAVTISGSTITGSTLSTATSGQRVVLFSTLASFYNSSGTLVASTYANSGAYLVKGEQSNSNIYLDAGTTGIVAFLTNGSTRLIFDYANGYLAPVGSGVDLGNISNQWDDFWHNGTETYQGMDMPVIYHGFVSSGSIVNDNFVPFSISNPATGRYTITHNFGHTDYTVQVTPQASTVKNITIDTYGTNSFTVRIANLSDTLENNDFFFTVFEYPQ